jgi:hypothetical protein
MSITEAYQPLPHLKIPGIKLQDVPRATRPNLASVISQKPEALDNDIHALFRFSLWKNITHRDYMRLLPALRLASLLLEQDTVIDWFCRTLLGSLNANDHGPPYYLGFDYLINIASIPVHISCHIR